MKRFASSIVFRFLNLALIILILFSFAWLLDELMDIDFTSDGVVLELDVDDDSVWPALLFIFSIGLKPFVNSRIDNRKVAGVDKKTFEAMKRKAEIDDLTGLYNRKTVQEKIEHYMDGHKKGKSYFLFMIDMDNFKNINDTYGHWVGDHVLRQTGALLKAIFENRSAYIGRIGGDEFIALLYDVDSSDAVSEFLSSIQERLRVKIPGTSEFFTGSVGYAPGRKGDTFEELYQRADEALYAAKRMRKREVIDSVEVSFGGE